MSITYSMAFEMRYLEKAPNAQDKEQGTIAQEKTSETVCSQRSKTKTTTISLTNATSDKRNMCIPEHRTHVEKRDIEENDRAGKHLFNIQRPWILEHAS